MKNTFKGHRKGSHGRAFCVYSVWENKTDRLVCIDAEAREAADAMGISLSSFCSTISRTKNGTHKKWTIIRDFYDEIEEEAL